MLVGRLVCEVHAVMHCHATCRLPFATVPVVLLGLVAGGQETTINIRTDYILASACARNSPMSDPRRAIHLYIREQLDGWVDSGFLLVSCV